MFSDVKCIFSQRKTHLVRYNGNQQKDCSIETPKNGTTFKLSDSVDFEISTRREGAVIDSVIIEFGEELSTFQGSSFTWKPEKPRTGTPRIKLTAYIEGKGESLYPKIEVLADESPKLYTYKILNTYPHDPGAYTQGLLVHDGAFIESTGKRGQSKLRRVEIETGKVLQDLDLDSDLFGEGCAIYNDEIFQLTWTSQRCFVYDFDFNLKKEFRIQSREGWGLSTFQDKLWMTDESELLYVIDPVDFGEIDRLQVYDHEGKVESTNELEFVEGELFANVYGEEYVVVIDPETGAVIKQIDFSGLIDRTQYRGLDYVLNGIAYDESNEKLYVTGKWWPNLFEVELIEKKTL